MTDTSHTCIVHTLDHLVLTVVDIGETCAFYTQTLGMRAEQFTTASGEVRWALKYGSSKINLHQQGQEFEPKAARPTPGSADLCFLTATPIDLWIKHLDNLNIQIEDGPVPRTGATGPLNSIYIRDPDKNLIEVSVVHPG
jgi:catechol 2,3-dioxygenase-like lactoylglutathione lyase family enzyme